MAALLAFSGQIAFAQSLSSSASLDAALYRSVCERIDGPMVFSTRDTLFALSLPVDERAEVYVQITVGRNGKVKEKLTRVNANHIGAYVAPAFVSATKDLRVDRSLVGNLTGKDTSLVLAFPLEYHCIYDTLSKEWPNMGDYVRESLRTIPDSYDLANMGWKKPIYPYQRRSYPELATYQIELDSRSNLWYAFSRAEREYQTATPTPIWYYLAFIRESQE